MIKGQKYRRFKTVKTVPFHLFLTFKRNERVTNFSELLHRCVGMTNVYKISYNMCLTTLSQN